MRHVDAYLCIPAEVGRVLDGLVWSLDGEALKRGDGTTFALIEEMLVFLEGFALGRPLVPFGYLLLTLGLIRGRWGPRPGASPTMDRLREAFQTTGRSERNAGAFFAHLLDDLPVAIEPPSVTEVWRRAVLNANDPLRLTTQGRLVPELVVTPEKFLLQIEQKLAGFSRDDLEAWLKTGVGPVRTAAQQLVEALQSRAACSLEGLLGDLAERQRLAGALPLIEQLSAALTLPPRKLIDPEFPLGGYADVTTHGRLDQLLLSQFALDELELLRRLAERELLYYRREEPRAEVREEFVVVLDQGVRTWGEPRLVLLAATFVLARIAEQRQQPFRIATTGRAGEPWSPHEIPPEELARRLEVADLSPHPGLTLERVLEEAPTQPRDVVLLTHSRTLDEPDVQAAALRVQAGVRLFALGVDREGHAGLGEFQHGRCVPVRSFRIDLDARRPGEPPAKAGGDFPGWNPWTGAIEPNPCLFFINPGPGNPSRIAFDAGETHLLLALADGMLMLVPLHGRAEMLPRSQVGSWILRRVEWVQGIPGGFLVGGASEDGSVVVAQYDLGARKVDAWLLGAAAPAAGWLYLPRLGCFVWQTPHRSHAVDLQTGEQRLQSGGLTRPVDDSRASAALLEATQIDHPPGWLRVVSGTHGIHGDGIHLDVLTGDLTIHHDDGKEWTFQPLEDGEPALRGGILCEARLRGDILALEAELPARDRSGRCHCLLVYQVPAGRLRQRLSSPRYTPYSQAWALSDEGNLIACETGHAQVEIRSTRPGGTRKQVTPRSRFDGDVHVALGDYWLSIHVSGHQHLLSWRGESLTAEVWHTARGESELRGLLARLAALGLTPKPIAATSGPPAFLGADADRYRVVLVGRLVAAQDTLGVVSLLAIDGRFLAQVYSRGDKIAVASPQGDAFGHPALLGRPATVDAARVLATLLRSAEQEVSEIRS